MDQTQKILLFIALLFVFCLCMNARSNEQAAGAESSNSNSTTESDFAKLQSDESTELDNNVMTDLSNQDSDSLNLEASFAEPHLERGLAELEDMPAPMDPALPAMDSTVDEPEPTVEEPKVEEPQVDKTILGYDSSDNQFELNTNELSDNNKKLKPNELLPKDAIDMTNNSFISANIPDTKTRVGNTQSVRSRKAYDIRSTPVIERKAVSPWNIGTNDPDTDRRHFEIGASACPPCPSCDRRHRPRCQ